ncbi:MAG TPA: hypothetical protein ENO24_02730 [Chloroflexi bacterium]|nr:hypothetical protein [Chloroflexota bacterium]
MKLRTALSYLWKVPVCGLAYMAGTVLGSIVAGLMGMATPAMPEGTTAETLMLFQLLATPFLALALAFLSRGLQGRFVARWLILSFLTWVAYGVNTVLEAAIFTTYGAASPFTVVIILFGSLACAALVAFLFPPQDRERGFFTSLKAFFGGRSGSQWAWRLALAAVAFMPIYLFFGRLVVPFTYDYYREQMAGLTAPGWGQILPVLFLRSVLFLAACLPVLVAWGRSRRSLVLSLGFALFVTVGGMGLIGGYWLPLSVRLFHGVEILADSLVYAWVLALLLVTRRT